jgi:hypothetical protein
MWTSEALISGISDRFSFMIETS